MEKTIKIFDMVEPEVSQEETFEGELLSETEYKLIALEVSQEEKTVETYLQNYEDGLKTLNKLSTTLDLESLSVEDEEVKKALYKLDSDRMKTALTIVGVELPDDAVLSKEEVEGYVEKIFKALKAVIEKIVKSIKKLYVKLVMLFNSNVKRAKAIKDSLKGEEFVSYPFDKLNEEDITSISNMTMAINTVFHLNGEINPELIRDLLVSVQIAPLQGAIAKNTEDIEYVAKTTDTLDDIETRLQIFPENILDMLTKERIHKPNLQGNVFLGDSNDVDKILEYGILVSTGLDNATFSVLEFKEDKEVIDRLSKREFINKTLYLNPVAVEQMNLMAYPSKQKMFDVLDVIINNGSKLKKIFNQTHSNIDDNAGVINGLIYRDIREDVTLCLRNSYALHSKLVDLYGIKRVVYAINVMKKYVDLAELQIKILKENRD